MLTISKNNRRGYVFALLSALTFGLVSAMAKPVVSSVNPLLLASFVYLISAITLTPLAQKTKFGSMKKRDYYLILLISLSGAVIAPSLYFSGLVHTTASDAALLANGEVFFSVLLAMVFFKEKLNSLGYVSVLLILVGLIIVTTNLDFSYFTLEQIHYQDVLVITSMLFWALDNNLSRIIAQKLHSAKIVQIKSAIGGTSLFMITIFWFKIPLDLDIQQIPAIILLGTVGFASSLYFFLNGLKHIGTIKTIMIFSLSSVFGLVSAFILLGEQISFYQIIAAGIMFGGVYLMNKKESSISPA